MAKNKQAKKKERERRVAQKKLAAAAQKREQETTGKKDLPKTFPGKSQLMTSAVPKADYIPTAKKNSVTQRRSGGG
jgi:hypothetical protein